MTQLEGMGVHAAFSARRDQHQLDTDADYRVYVDALAARRVTERYAELLALLSPFEGVVDDETVGTILNAMSSGERIWYQVGALACRELERKQGRRTLIEAIQRPEIFDQALSVTLTPSS